MSKRLNRMHRRRWLIYVNALKSRYPLPHPVRVITCRLSKELHGDADLIIGRHKCYRVRISNRGGFGQRRDTLAHEYAHCLATLSWHEPNGEDPIADHDEIWAVWQTRCERLLTETYEKLPEELKDKSDRNQNPEG